MTPTLKRWQTYKVCVALLLLLLLISIGMVAGTRGGIHRPTALEYDYRYTTGHWARYEVIRHYGAIVLLSTLSLSALSALVILFGGILPWSQKESRPPVHTTDHFVIEPCLSCPIAGYLIVSPIIPALSLSQLRREALDSLGATLAAATRAIETVIRPERVYCALFTEETPSIHFHLFPRSRWLLSQYASAHSGDREVSGPRLFEWARRTFHSPAPEDYDQLSQAIFRELTPNL